jgi:cell division protein FtsB
MTQYAKMKRQGRSRAARQQMAETQRQFVRGVLFLIGVTLLIIFIFGDHGLFQLYKLKRERAQIQEHISQLRESREKLIAEKNRLENDLEYIEKLARERFRMAKPGEKVFKVIPKKEPEKQTKR